MSKSHIVIDVTDKSGKPKQISLGVNLPFGFNNTGNEEHLTKKPIFMEKGTDGSFGTKGSYVLFGDWPQSLKAKEVTIDESRTFALNQWKCYKGSDNCYYVKEAAKPFNINLKNEVINQTFSNGDIVEEGKEYYFKIEPIKWRILDNDYSGGKLLLAENVLISGCYDTHYNRAEKTIACRTVKDEDVYPNNYKYSRIRAYLNGLNGSNYSVDNYKEKGFINLAFTDTAIDSLKAVNINNGKTSLFGRGDSIINEYLDEDNNPYKYAGKSTKDRVFLLSEVDITNKEYGFTSSDDESGYSVRRRKATDYAIALGADTNEDTSKVHNCSWYLRSPHYAFSFGCRGVFANGTVNFACSVSFDQYGIVPAVCLIDTEL